jgi:polyisoprenyl-teichoic acid--peptidoglycan teichoic acid transferase
MSSLPSNTMDDERPRSAMRGMWGRFLIASVLIVLLSGAATATFALDKVSDIAHEVFPKLNEINAPKGLITPVYNGGPQTFLILGSDRRTGSKNTEERDAGAHSDTILLVRFDPEQGQTSVLSIPRDLLVNITTESGQTYPDEKINAAYTIGSKLKGTDGGARLAALTIKHEIPGLEINHIVDVTFRGFIDVVDTLGCVYVNVDHRYYNPPNSGYTAIDLQPGYQKLCYENALDYVRYRHTDSDFVRVARQQDFIRDLREQISPVNVIGQIDTVAKAVGRSISSSIHASASELIQLAKLVAFSQSKPLRQVKFRTSNVNYQLRGESFVTSTPDLIQATLNEFLHGRSESSLPAKEPGSSSKHHRHQKSAGASSAAIGLYPTSRGEEGALVTEAVGVPFPVLYPTLQTGPAVQENTRAYTLKDQHNHLHHAYVVVFKQSNLGGYYDIEGTDWLNPPIVAHPDETRTIGSRSYMVSSDGGHIHTIAWRSHGVLYWVTNTLLEELSNQQMLGIARSVQPLR